MQYTNQNPTVRFASVLTGDGRTERRLLRQISAKLNGKSITLFDPSTPLVQSARGLRSLIKALKVEISVAKNLTTLLLIDREHIRYPEEIIKVGSEFGSTIEILFKDNSYAHATMKFGDKKAEIYLAILGAEKCLEEEIACLISKLRKNNLSPSKGAVRKYFDDSRTDVESLVKEATEADLRKCFPSLMQALIQLEHDIAAN